MNEVRLRVLIAAADAVGTVVKEEHGMIYQVWEDGEVTLQKCGPLLWQRNLHMISPGNPSIDISEHLPNKDSKHAWVWCEGHKEVNDILAELGLRKLAG